jgi:hypothetical protein
MQDDCTGDQTCSGGFCVSSADVQCMTSPTTGGGGNGTQGADVDAGIDAPPDAPTHGLVTVDVAGHGYVELDGVGTCDSDAPQSGHCEFTIPLTQTVTTRAVPDSDWEFERWTTSTCPAETTDTCVFVPTVTMQLAAKFRKDD